VPTEASHITVTRIGGPTVLIEVAGWRIIVDPTFDPAGRAYSFGAGTSSVKTTGPAIAASEIGRIDLALVSHDQHADNLDDAGRALLDDCDHVLTTVAAARRFAEPHVQGVAPHGSVALASSGKPDIEVTGTPCRHGPALAVPLVGPVVGFLVRAGERSVWVTGDTVMYPALTEFARDLRPDLAIVNAGGVQFGKTGRVRYTMTGADAVKLMELAKARVVVPAHYEGWSHFRDDELAFRSAVEAASGEVRASVRFLPTGEPMEI
jgi:L-ascorbate metabolism protein UlaG (beta-lactamase superfamily)